MLQVTKVSSTSTGALESFCSELRELRLLCCEILIRPKPGICFNLSHAVSAAAFASLLALAPECVPTCHDAVHDIFVGDVVLVRLRQLPF